MGRLVFEKGRSSGKRAPLLALAKRLGGTSLEGEVRLAADDALAYLKKFRKRMDDIGVDAPQRNLAWLALVQGLTARRSATCSPRPGRQTARSPACRRRRARDWGASPTRT